jgi:glycosyltransferase involved in cell wall biosynthesis
VHRISVITICFNNLEDVKKTCASVDMQESKPYEHIIIDGSTTDEVRKYLESTRQPSYRKWICERDKGIADAFNKGIRKATGEITTLLNSGDTLYDATVLRRVEEAFAKDETIMWSNGLLNMHRAGMWVIIGKSFEKSKLYRGMHGVFHPTMYVKKEVYDRRGYFDINVKIGMDYDFLCRIADEKSTFINYPIANFDPGGVSNVRYLEGVKECAESYKKYYGGSLMLTYWQWRLTVLHYLLQSPIGKILYRAKVAMGMKSH